MSEKGPAGISKLLLIVVVLIIGAILFAKCIHRINPGYVGIRVNLAGSQRGVADIPIVTGWVFVNPLTQQVFEYPTFIQTVVWSDVPHEGRHAKEAISFNDSQQITVKASINISYSIDPMSVPAFYVQFRNDNIDLFTHGYLHTVTRDAINLVGSKYTFDELNGVKKGDFIQQIRDKISEDIKQYGVNITQFGFAEGLDPSPAVKAAIDAKLQAVQKAIQTENELRASTAEGAKRVAIAEAEAKIKVLTADSEAKANELLTKSLTPQLLEWRKLQITAEAVAKWNGVRPTVEAGAGAGGLLLNITPK
ncbi:MAG: hypothetical protein HQK97_05550 [Nitrospirae bacterium]|nr:hypothetical protein [Nitrospirota bacterium]